MMLFRWRRRRDTLAEAWEGVAARLGLEHVAGGAGAVCELLDIPEDSNPEPVYRVSHAGPVDVYVFSYSRAPEPRSGVQAEATVCLLVSPQPLVPVSWRAGRKLHSVLASLQASAVGGEVIEVPGDSRFNASVTVVARESGTILPLLTPATRSLLLRSLTRDGAPRELTVGENRILLAAVAPQVAFEDIEYMLSDTLSLYAALSG